MTDSPVEGTASPLEPTEQPERLDLRSHDIVTEKQQELLRLFPEIRTEGGKIDFDRLRRALGETVDPGKERYGMRWPGKSECFKAIQQSTLATLIPMRGESVNFDTTRHIVIEGDNLEVLKLLQKSYLGKIKIIYIDPPYNTGGDFIYPDNYAESLRTYLEYTGQVNAEGKRFTTNAETDGRFHSKWMNMMYPRLYLARNLLREDGVMLISIDDREADNLRKLCGEIFGEENIVAQLVWEKGRKNDAKLVSVGHEYILLVAKQKAYFSDKSILWREAKPGAAEIQSEYLNLRRKFGNDNAAVQKALRQFYAGLPKTHPSKKHSRYSNVDDQGVWRDDNMSWPGGGGPTYVVIHPKTGKPCALPEGGWRYATPEKMQEMIAKGKVVFRADHTEPPIRKTYLVRTNEDEDQENAENGDEDVGIQVAGTYFYRSALQASNVLTQLFGERIFDNPKDHEVLMRWFAYVGSNTHDDIILDFFAGTGTTGHAVLQLNRQDGGTRQFILVQLPEPTSLKNFPTIADIAKERMRRVAKALAQEDEKQAQLPITQQPDYGFRVFKLAESNFALWNSDASVKVDDLVQQLELHVNHIRQDRSTEDTLFELLLKSGFPLSVTVEALKIADKQVFAIADRAMLICLEPDITTELIRGMADMKPERIICLDAGFKGNDQLKTNAVQVMKSKGVTSFRTV